jgi:hypothetical protein
MARIAHHPVFAGAVCGKSVLTAASSCSYVAAYTAAKRFLELVDGQPTFAGSISQYRGGLFPVRIGTSDHDEVLRGPFERGFGVCHGYLDLGDVYDIDQDPSRAMRLLKTFRRIDSLLPDATVSQRPVRLRTRMGASAKSKQRWLMVLPC